MKYARTDKIVVKLPNDSSNEIKTYNVLTINDPCQACKDDSCSNFPQEVGAYRCKDGLTENGLRINGDKITSGPGRLIFALFHSADKNDRFDLDFPKQCTKRHQANLEELDLLGGMGNIFVKLATLSKEETYQICDK